MGFEVKRWQETLPPEVDRLRRRLESEGYTVSEFTDPPGAVYESHSHEDDQVHWIISGEAEFEVDGQKYRLGPGDRDFLPANTDHAAAVLGDQPVRYLVGVKSR